jgi:hypothetical protein
MGAAYADVLSDQLLLFAPVSQKPAPNSSSSSNGTLLKKQMMHSCST